MSETTQGTIDIGPILKELFSSEKGQGIYKGIKAFENIIIAGTVVTIIISILLIATCSIGLDIYNKCDDFGENKVSGLQDFFIAFLVVSILAFIIAVVALALYLRYGKALTQFKSIGAAKQE